MPELPAQIRAVTGCSPTVRGSRDTAPECLSCSPELCILLQWVPGSEPGRRRQRDNLHKGKPGKRTSEPATRSRSPFRISDGSGTTSQSLQAAPENRLSFFTGGNLDGRPGAEILRNAARSCSENFRLSQIEHTKFFRLPARLTEQVPFTQCPFCQFPAAIVQNRYNLPNISFARRRTTGKTERGTMFSRIGSKQLLRSSGEPEPLKRLSQN